MIIADGVRMFLASLTHAYTQRSSFFPAENIFAQWYSVGLQCIVSMALKGQFVNLKNVVGKGPLGVSTLLLPFLCFRTYIVN